MSANLQLSIILGAALAGGFSNTFNNAGSSVNKLQEKLSALGKNQDAIQKFGRLQSTMTQTADKLNAARGRVRELGEQMRATSTPSEQLKRQFTAAHQEVAKLQGKLGDERRELGQLRTSLNAAGVDTKNFSDEQVRLTRETELAAQAEKARQAQERVAAAQGKYDATKQNLSNMKGDILASAGILLALKAPINTAANFVQAMARVGAVSGATGSDFERLTEQARQLGRDTQYTATQAANSQELLARAGFSTEEIVKTMPGLLNMAAAEGMDLATAADIAASSLRGFQLSADQSDRVADVLAKTSASTNTSIQTLGESFKMVGPIAAGLNIPFEEVAAMIGSMGDAGIKGSEAGTALRAALVRLSKEPKQTYQALEKLGVATRDTAGNMRTMPDLLASLSKKMEGMGNADKMEALTKIFGTEAAAGMLAVMDAANSGKLEELTEELEKADGAAKKMADRMNDTAQGAMKRLGSATESLMIDIGNALLPTFTQGVEILSGFISSVSALAQKYPGLTKVIVFTVAALGAFKVGLTAGKIALNLVKLPFQKVALLSAKYNEWLVANGHTSIWLAIKTKLLAIRQKAATLATKAWTIAQKAWGAVMRGGRWLLDIGRLIAHKAATIAASVATKAWTAAQWLWTTAMTVGGKLLSVGKLIAYKAASIAIAVASKAWAAAQWLLNAAMNANPIGLIIIGIAALVAAGYYLYKNWDKVCAWVSGAWQWVWNKIKAFGEWLKNIFSWDGVTKSFETAKNLLGNGWNTVKGWFGEKLSFAWDWLSSGFDTAKNLVSSGWETLKGSFIWEGASKAWDGLTSAANTAWSAIKSGWNTVSGLIEGGLTKAGDMLSGAWSWLKDVTGFGEDAAAAEEQMLAAQLGDITMLNKMSLDFKERVQEMTDAWQPFKVSLGEGFQNIWDIMLKIGEDIKASVIPAVNSLSASLRDIETGVKAIGMAAGIKVTIPQSVSQAAARVPAGPNGNGMIRHAEGGIFDRPHFGLFAEKDTESIIPHNPSGENIWRATGEMAGFSAGVPEGITFSPSINLTVNAGSGADGNAIGRQIIREIEAELPRMLKRFNEQQARVAY